MVEIYQFLKLAETYFYILLGIIGLIYFKKLIDAFTDYRQSVFGLEKDKARRHIFQAGGILILGLIAGIGEFTFVSYIDNNPMVYGMQPTPTINLNSTETPMMAQPDNLTVPAQGENVVAITETTMSAVNCEPGLLEWISPTEGNEVRGKIELKGTVNIPDFGFYKYEYSLDNINWNTMQAGTTIVTDGVLGEWDTGLLTPGDYYLRLIATNSQGNALPACVINVRVLSE